MAIFKDLIVVGLVVALALGAVGMCSLGVMQIAQQAEQELAGSGGEEGLPEGNEAETAAVAGEAGEAGQGIAGLPQEILDAMKEAERKVAEARGGLGLRGDEVDETPTEAQPPEPLLDKLDKETVITIVDGMTDSIMPCLWAADEAGELKVPKFTIMVDFTIGADGKVSDPVMKGPKPLLKTSLKGCVTQAMTSWEFPPAKNPSKHKGIPVGPFTRTE